LKTRRIIFGVAVAALLLPCIARAAGYPGWWTNVVDDAASATNDYAAANVGQLKWFATNTCDELAAHLPGGAGSALSNLVSGFSLSGNYVAVNQGQLKHVASKVYDRLIAEGYTNSHPWTAATTDDVDYAAANLGQLKHVFSFDLREDTDADGLPDWMEWAIINADMNDSLEALADVLPEDDFDGDGYLNIYEAHHTTHPTNSSSAPDPTYHVDCSVSSNGNGSAESPFKTIQAGLDAASNDYDIVQVANGTYTGTGNKDLNMHGRSLMLVSAGTAGDCIIDCEYDGRGFNLTNSEPREAVIARLSVTHGQVSDDGGAVCLDPASPTVVECRFGNNAATNTSSGAGRGGAVWVDATAGTSDPAFIECAISWNYAKREGGGICCSTDSSPLFLDCAIVGNSSKYEGGGAYCGGGSSPEFNRCAIVANKTWSNSKDGGGLAFVSAGASLVKDCVIRANVSDDDAGGVFFEQVDNVTLENCLVVENHATGDDGDGGAFYCKEADPVLLNCTVAGNYADKLNGALARSDSLGKSYPTNYNCIYWGNESGTPSDQIAPQDSKFDPYFSYSYIEGGWSGRGTNISTNDPDLNEFTCRLPTNSPCIDAGATNTVLLDLDRESRTDDTNKADVVSIWDVGADEFVDTDADGMADVWELTYLGTLSSNGTADADGDGVDNLYEYENGGNPFNSDTDGDGLSDGVETNIGTLISNVDTDGDTMPDGWEYTYTTNLNPLDASDKLEDPDGDCLANYQEYAFGTHPLLADTDGDGTNDNDEVDNGTDPVNVQPEDEGGQAPVSIVLRVGDESDRPCEAWKLVIGGDEGASTNQVGRILEPPKPSRDSLLLGWDASHPAADLPEGLVEHPPQNLPSAAPVSEVVTFERGKTYSITVTHVMHITGIREDEGADMDYVATVGGYGLREQYDMDTYTDDPWYWGSGFVFDDRYRVYGNWDSNIIPTAAYSETTATLHVPGITATNTGEWGCCPVKGQAVTNRCEVAPSPVTKPDGTNHEWGVEWVLMDAEGGTNGTECISLHVDASNQYECVAVLANTKVYQRLKQESENGVVRFTLRARLTDSNMEGVYDDVELKLGCSSCEDESCDDQPGRGTTSPEQPQMGTGLGKLPDGRSAGDLQISFDSIGPEHATPSGLKLNDSAGGLDVIWGDGMLRQVKAPDALADIEVLTSQKYTIDFYESSKVSLTPGAQGLYTVDAGESPLVTWTVENPDAGCATNRLKVTETRGTNSIVHVLFSPTNTYCSLSEAGGMRIRSVTNLVTASETTKTMTTLDSVSNTVFVKEVRTVYDGGIRTLSEVTVDPDGESLTTTRTYYTDPGQASSYRMPKLVVRPDGSWEKYAYTSAGNVAGLLSTATSGVGDADTNETVEVRVVNYDYTPRGGEPTNSLGYKPRKVWETVTGITTRVTYYGFETNAQGLLQEVTERCVSSTASYGDADNLRTTVTRDDLGIEDWDERTGYPDGRLTTVLSEIGDYTPASDAPGSFEVDPAGAYKRITTTHGTADNPDGIACKTTREVRIESLRGHAVERRTLVYADGGYSNTSSWTVVYCDDFGRATNTVHSDGTRTETSWGCCGRNWQVDRSGIRTEYTYDDLHRMTMSCKVGVSAGDYPAQANVYATTVLDAADRTVAQTNSAGSLALSTARTYDSAGRPSSSTDQAGLVTTNSYAGGGKTTTTVSPGPVTNVTVRYAEGRTKTVTVNGMLRQTYRYGVDSNGDSWTKVYTGTDGTSSAMWSTTTTDMLGRTVKQERPAFGGGTLTSTSVYATNGLLTRTTAPGTVPTLYTYDELGNRFRTALDANTNSTVDLNGPDRITESVSWYEEDGSGDWWRISSSAVYAHETTNTVTTNSVSKTRLTGLSSNLVSETVSIDIHGNTNVSQRAVDRDAKLVTDAVDSWDSTNDAVTVTLNGLAVSMESKTGLEYSHSYDALGRRTGTTDPRIGASSTHYNGKGQVGYVLDAASNKTSYAYDAETGRRIAATNAMGKVTRYDHDPDGRLLKTWGDTVYPVKYAYDNDGRMTSMTTYRSGSDWTSSTWPDPEPSGDTTTWRYDEATGLLTNKVYADGNGVSYAYTSAGKLETRTWARGETTTNRYDITGLLTNIDYSASDTADIAFTHDRLGRQKTVIDAHGTNTFAYNGSLQLSAVTNGFGSVVTRAYDSKGRSAGFDLDSVLDVDYAYTTLGRFGSVTWTNSVAGGAKHSAAYSYVPQSDLLRKLDIDNGELVATRFYEDDRNLIAAVSNAADSTMISLYQYTNDDLGRRTDRIDSGTAFSPAVTNDFGYNDRSELTGADMGTDDYGYAYDPIGNRISCTNNSEVWSYLANGLNQYTNVADGTTNGLLHDLDGNLTNDGVRAYSWNGENRLIQVEPANPSSGDKKVKLTYDYMGRRVEKVVSTYSGGWSVTQTNTYLYDGWNLVQETVDDQASTVTNHFVWGLDLSGSLQGAGGIGGLVSWSRSDTTTNFLYCYDANGNVGQLVDAANATNIVASYGPDPFGNMATITGSESSRNPFRFSSKYTDDETDLVYYGYRYYSPEMGRWLNRDPIGETGGLNLHVFADGDPLNRVDYLGWKGVTDHFRQPPPGYVQVECVRGDRVGTHPPRPPFSDEVWIPGYIDGVLVNWCLYRKPYEWYDKEGGKIKLKPCTALIVVGHNTYVEGFVGENVEYPECFKMGLLGCWSGSNAKEPEGHSISHGFPEPQGRGDVGKIGWPARKLGNAGYPSFEDMMTAAFTAAKAEAEEMAESEECGPKGACCEVISVYARCQPVRRGDGFTERLNRQTWCNTIIARYKVE